MLLLAPFNRDEFSFAIKHVLALFVQLAFVVRPAVRKEIAIRLDRSDIRETPGFAGFRHGVTQIKLVEHHDHFAVGRERRFPNAIGGQVGQFFEFDMFMVVFRALGGLAILLACPEFDHAGYHDTTKDESGAEDGVSFGVHFFGMEKDFGDGIHFLGTFLFLCVIQN